MGRQCEGYIWKNEVGIQGLGPTVVMTLTAVTLTVTVVCVTL